MNRREMMRLMAASGLAVVFPWSSRLHAAPFTGTFLLNVILTRGLDQSSWGDPRNDTKINNWAKNNNAGRAGNLMYAPMMENREFFDEFHDRILMINGIDVDSGSHKVADIVQQTGTKSTKDPSITALYAGIVGKDLPLPWITYNPEMRVFSGGVQTDTRVNSVNFSQFTGGGSNVASRMIRNSDVGLINQARLVRIERLLRSNSRMPYEQNQLEQLRSTHINSTTAPQVDGSISFDSFDFASQSKEKSDQYVMNKAHIMLTAFAAGMTASATLELNGKWDTHKDHDRKMDVLLKSKTDTLRYVWDKAEALGIADRLLIYVTSDVGRRPYYNSNKGKDHWSTTSCMLMMKNQNWTDRVIGMTSSSHDKVKINPNTGQASNNGVQLTVPHVHRAVHRILGIQNNSLTNQFSFNAAEVDLLNPSASSPVNV